jgi:hypothetical protein
MPGFTQNVALATFFLLQTAHKSSIESPVSGVAVKIPG